MRPRFEYKVLFINTTLCGKETVEYQLNELGKEGWELVTVDTKYGWYYLMKEKTDDEDNG